MKAINDTTIRDARDIHIHQSTGDDDDDIDILTLRGTTTWACST